jgi:glycolate oxidase FAD binding subunit
MSASERLPLARSSEPADAAALAEVIREAGKDSTPVYPIGGGTALDFGLPARTPGIGLSLAKLDRVIDYPARDMTITVEAGITMAALARTLAAENQQLPIDAPLDDRATLGGVIATNWSGPRRYGYGTIRDYVIGMSAVDGTGRPFKGGGRVVKNVAGYDFCKLLVGSLGTIGVITQVTLKVRPLPQRSVLATCDVADFDTAERLSAALVTSRTTPAAVELLTGPDWLADAPSGAAVRLVVGLEGTRVEVEWMQTAIAEEWRSLGVADTKFFADADSDKFLQRLVEWSAQPGSPLVIKATLRPSCVTRFVAAVRETDPQASMQAHAGSGIVIVRFAHLAPGAVTKKLLGQLYPLATSCGGHVTVLSAEPGVELTPKAAFYASELPLQVMRSVKRQFDPQNILNPGRFVY